ncbi:uncharacterized protein LOC118204681, partial [Stegodyphus dumicola]|uniref:uncharacterized protein LOC118204681 n=1 Tax=Stegodyphus dumicola TaxID=202533 RepID=UPI0015AE500A
RESFDPLVLLGPVIAKAKIFLQRLWVLKLNWDDYLPDKEAKEWQRFFSELPQICKLEINRCILVAEAIVIELHGFCDASELAYGAVVYCKSISQYGEVVISLVTSKSKVSPVKQVTIPRLELCAAVLLAKLMTRVISALKFNVNNVFFCSDSLIVLAWLKKEPCCMKTFVANRVAVVQEMTEVNSRSVQQQMADLPAARVTISRVFAKAGLDFCGPFLVKNFVGRSKQVRKVFVCFTTKALHFEIVNGLTSAAFIAALKRFIARRGKPSDIFSDNGRNFVGAHRELRAILKSLFKDKSEEEIKGYLATEGINWHFNPPSTPHFGGLWEASVKSLKYHLNRVVGKTILTYEEFFTLIVQIESVLNSRPLCPISNDPNDVEALTPAHFLIASSLIALPEPNFTEIPIYRITRCLRCECWQYRFNSCVLLFSMARITRSAKDLWSLISGSSVLNNKDLIQYELEENSDRIINGVLFFKKTSQASLDLLKKSVEESQFDFVNKLSKLLDVDHMQCYELFVSYITYEYKGTQKSFEALLLSERHVHSLILEVWHYYFGERLYYLLILKHILSHWQDDGDSYKDIYESFLDKVNKDNIVVTKIISQMEASIGVELPTKDSHGPYMTEILAYHWTTFILKEQCELLQLLLLYYKDIEPTISDVQKMLLLFQDHGFGLRQSFRLSTLEGTQPFVNLIGFLESFVIVQCFELDWFYKCKESQMIGEHYLLKDMQAVKMLNDSILNLGSNQSHAPILLAWLAIAQGSEVQDMMMHCNKLGKLALHLGVFEYLVTALSAFSEKGVVSEVANGVVYSLLSAVLSEFDLQHLGSIQTLCTIACAVLRFPSVADNFWKRVNYENNFCTQTCIVL